MYKDAEDFFNQYCNRNKISKQKMLELGECVVECHCLDETCFGYAMINIDSAKLTKKNILYPIK